MLRKRTTVGPGGRQLCDACHSRAPAGRPWPC